VDPVKVTAPRFVCFVRYWCYDTLCGVVLERIDARDSFTHERDNTTCPECLAYWERKQKWLDERTVSD